MDERLDIYAQSSKNIFCLNKGDGGAYFVLYLVIPVLITFIGLCDTISEGLPAVHFYVTILISAANCIYDAANRWDKDGKTVKNTKLFLVIASTTVVGIYSLAEALYMLITQNKPMRWDFVLVVYFVTVFVALTDIITCFGVGMEFEKIRIPKLRRKSKQGSASK